MERPFAAIGPLCRRKRTGIISGLIDRRELPHLGCTIAPQKPLRYGPQGGFPKKLCTAGRQGVQLAETE
jgi:hypothetical protein